MREFIKLICFSGGVVTGIGIANYEQVSFPSPQKGLEWIGIGVFVFLISLFISLFTRE